MGQGPIESARTNWPVLHVACDASQRGNLASQQATLVLRAFHLVKSPVAQPLELGSTCHVALPGAGIPASMETLGVLA
ncbi:MAG: hypothetical protein ACLQDI_01850, partial [Syntrophobacteraceae bacterium]